MRRRRSDELPRFVKPSEGSSFRWPRRNRLIAAVGALFLFCLYWGRSSTSNGDAAAAINWMNYAYSLYATDQATLCHAVMVFDALERHGSKADRILWYPKKWDLVVSNSRDRNSQLLQLALKQYRVKLQPIDLLTVEGRTEASYTGTWDRSVTKFMAWQMVFYTRVIALDSDITLLQSLDELFLLPQTAIAMPRAYWYDTRPWPLTSLLMVIKPDLKELNHFKKVISGGGDDGLVRTSFFDMEMVNERFADSAMILPHRPYALLSGEFRRHNHTEYLGNPQEKWDARKVFNEAKLIHFSDWPLPKPWIMWPHEGLSEMQPDCGGSHEGTCEERVIWKGLYEDFRARRKDVCKLLSVPAPDWHGVKPASHEVAGNSTQETGHEAPQVDGKVEVDEAKVHDP
ncbi:glycosyltransferase family 8 protein [Amniculicola lignicola CBS 123094]|uniref:Glycosyltransferase family 8 protein n=1 Tax=Amniculicola lignicola CBS 123094 TaxID=1392246 RepID=A0A6A5WHE4_9PLEO|nr:glycosyltransferase family 8 protein [Amniculicola lignicola CBS 123094]